MQGPVTDGSAVSRELVMSPAAFGRISRILNEVSGISLQETKESLVYSRLAKRIRALRMSSFEEYCDHISSDHGEEERGELLSALTTNVTRFFREPHHFADLTKAVLEPIKARPSGRRVRIWSAACSSGEEPYSIAMTVLETLPRAHEMDVRILATDIDPKVVARGEAGIYPAATVTPLSDRQRESFLISSGDHWELRSEPRALIRFARLNLMERFPMQGKFDAIFCRNVAIYFDKPTQESLWQRLVDQLHPGGRLYIGHSERISGPALDRLDLAGVTTYSVRDHRPAKERV